MVTARDVMRLARDISIYEIDVTTGARIDLTKRPIVQLKGLSRSVFVFFYPGTRDPQAFATVTLYNGKIGLEVSKSGANEMHIMFRGKELGVLPLSTEADKPNLGYLPIIDLTTFAA